jgi:glycosyltransferase involved in cell wall biosynthesis
MKIVYVCNEYPPAPHGGIGTFVQTISQGMAGGGHRVTVVGLARDNAERMDGQVRVITLARARIRAGRPLLDRRRLRRWITADAAHDPVDIVEVPECDGLLPYDMGSVPVAVRLHLSVTAMKRQAGRRPHRWVYGFERKTLLRHPHWIGVSEYAVRLTERTFNTTAPPHCRVIYYPVVLPAAEKCEIVGVSRDYVLYAGTVCARKGAYILAEAARTFLAGRPNLSLVYAGKLWDEVERDPDARIRRILGPELAGRVVFTGHVARPAVFALMRTARVFAFPSALETFGLVTAEAMLAGVPVVTCEGGPNPEIVTHGKTGLLVPAGDASALASAVGRLLDQPRLATEMGNAAKAFVESHFSLVQAVEGTLAFYREAIAHRSVR